MPFGLGPWEVIIVLVILLLIFGPKRLPGMARSVGRRARDTKDAVVQAKDEVTAGLGEPSEQPTQQAQTVVGQPHVDPAPRQSAAPPKSPGLQR
jgi:sec-independent protein translocase protein TatA